MDRRREENGMEMRKRGISKLTSERREKETERGMGKKIRKDEKKVWGEGRGRKDVKTRKGEKGKEWEREKGRKKY
jgi:hypothetical protein